MIITATRLRRNYWNDHMETQLEADLPEELRGAFVSYARDYHADGRHLSEHEANLLQEDPAQLVSELRLHVGSRVLVTHNLKTHANLRNGTPARVLGFNRESKVVYILNELTDEVHELTPIIRTIRPRRIKDASIRRAQLPLVLGWAGTCHKIQGWTCTSVYIDHDATWWDPQQFYVAATRVRGMRDLHFLSLDRYRFGVVNPRINAVVAFLQERAEALLSGKPVVRFWNELCHIWEDTADDQATSRPFEDAVDATETSIAQQTNQRRRRAQKKHTARTRTPLIPKHFWRAPLDEWSVVPLNLPAGVRATATGLTLNTRQYRNVPGFFIIQDDFGKSFVWTPAEYKNRNEDEATQKKLNGIAQRAMRFIHDNVGAWAEQLARAENKPLSALLGTKKSLSHKEYQALVQQHATSRRRYEQDTLERLEKRSQEWRAALPKNAPDLPMPKSEPGMSFTVEEMFNISTSLALRFGHQEKLEAFDENYPVPSALFWGILDPLSTWMDAHPFTAALRSQKKSAHLLFHVGGHWRLAIALAPVKHVFLYDPYGDDAVPPPLHDALAEECMEEGWAFSKVPVRHLVQPSAHPLTGICCALLLETFYRHLGDDEFSSATRANAFCRMYPRDRYQICHLSWGTERLLDFEEQNQTLLRSYAVRLCTVVADEAGRRPEAFQSVDNDLIPWECKRSTEDEVEGFHQWNGAATRFPVGLPLDPYQPGEVRCSAKDHSVPRSRLVLFAGSCAVCEACCPNLRSLRLDEDYDADLWRGAFRRLEPFVAHDFVDHFLLYAVRVFFLDLLNHGVDYAVRYSFHRQRLTTLEHFVTALPNDLPPSAAGTRSPYYYWMANLQRRLGLPRRDTLNPDLCQKALQAFRQKEGPTAADEANAMEEVLIYYFLFAAARACPVPDMSGHRSKRQRRTSDANEGSRSLHSTRIFCNVLGIPLEHAENADSINRAFRKKALSSHPDKWSHLPDKAREDKVAEFKELTNARDELLKTLS
jgi:hypothetical protein